MTSPESIDLKEIVFINERARLDYEAMPEDVKESADQAITQLQNQMPVLGKNFKAITNDNNLADVGEIVLPYDGDTYRVYVIQFDHAIYILDAGDKKSPTGNEIPKNQKARLKTRRTTAIADNELNKRTYARRAKSRAALKTAHDKLLINLGVVQ